MTRGEQRARMKAMAEMYRDRFDLTIYEIADRWGVTPNTIAHARKFYGVPARHPNMAAAHTLRNADLEAYEAQRKRRRRLEPHPRPAVVISAEAPVLETVDRRWLIAEEVLTRPDLAYREIATRYGVSKQTVYKCARDFDVPYRNPKAAKFQQRKHAA